MEPGKRKSNEIFGFAILGLFCALNTVPVRFAIVMASADTAGPDRIPARQPVGSGCVCQLPLQVEGRW